VLPTYTNTATAPWQLEWNDKGAAPTVPNLVGVGHSYGGNGLVQASVIAPDAFSSLFLIEPMVRKSLFSTDNRTNPAWAPRRPPSRSTLSFLARSSAAPSGPTSRRRPR
jgi:hypothetical protein